MRAIRLAVAFAALAGLAMGCASQTEEEDAAADEGELSKGPNSDRWVYNGTLPHLEDPSLVVSQAVHTVRVSGYLPAGYDLASLPFYVDTLVEGGRTKIAVVYPIATGSSVNHQPNEYRTERVYPRRTDSSAPWGGFPFISYVNDDSPYKGIAFHGPITAADGEWKVIRGPVSHGCNRMQGEHVVELAHLIGVNMTTKLWSTSAGSDPIIRNLKVPVTVIRDRADTWKGQNVDVQYPAKRGVMRPTENVKMFRAWRSNDFPSWVCRVDARNLPPANAVPTDYCASALGLHNQIDPRVGPSVEAEVEASETACSSTTLGRTLPENSCVQSGRDRTWYRCAAGEWAASSEQDGACTARYAL